MFRLVVLAAVLALACGASLGPAPRDVQSRIVAGDTFDIASVPWQVAIQYDINGEGMYIMICGGTIVSDRYIMVSAWCLVYNTGLMWIRVGSDSHSSGGTIHSVRSSKIHPNYNSTTKDYDVALMQLFLPITLGSNVRIATLPAQDEAVPVNAEGYASGWGRLSETGGRPSLLNKIDLTVTDQEECRTVYEGEREVTERMFCAGGKGAGTCDGDTGGPFVVDGVVVGITSWRLGCGREGIPDVFTKVSSVREWIRGQI